MDFVQATGEVTSAQLVEALDIPYGSLINDINALITSGRLEPTAPPRSRNRAYRTRGAATMTDSHRRRTT